MEECEMGERKKSPSLFFEITAKRFIFVTRLGLYI